MTDRHPFRFGVVAATARRGDEWAEGARRIESLGYATLLTPDRVEHTLSPLPALMAAAAATTTLRVGTYVVANDFRNPVLLAKDTATLDLLSDGRFELGLGAGIPLPEDARRLGISFDPGRLRRERLAESVALVERLWAGEPSTGAAGHYRTEEATITPRPVQQPRPPILIAGAGKQTLGLAAREADSVALSIQVTDPETVVAEKVGWLREASGQRFDDLELNVNLMAVGDAVPSFVRFQMGLTADRLAASGAFPVLPGTTDAMCDTLLRWREALHISYVVVGDEMMEPLAPVVARLAGR
jgi:probable F420-dependent oxidoreductase